MTKESASEKSIEQYLREQVRALGGRTLKLEPSNAKGVPDRLVILPLGRVAFVELKRPSGGVLAPLQAEWKWWLEINGHRSVVLSSKAEVDQFLRRA